MNDEDIILESNSSGPATPIVISNPGTPRSMESAEMRNTPPPGALNLSAVSSSQQQQPRPTQQHQTQQQQPQSKYTQLLAVIEEMGKDIRPTYAGSKTSAERLKRGITHARILVRECLMECERAARN